MNVVAAAKTPIPAAGKATPTNHALKGPELPLYTDYPQEDVAIDEFEKLALDRLSVLKCLDEAKLRSRSEQEIQVEVDKVLKDKLFQKYTPQERLRRDRLSHFILRLAYCRTGDLRKWFLGVESELFRLRFARLDREQQLEFLASNNLPYKAASADELTPELLSGVFKVLRSCGTKVNEQDLKSPGMFYKVPFQQVPDLVANRKVLLVKGTAYVVKDQLASLVVQDFRAKLSKGLAELNIKWRSLFPDNDEHIRPLVMTLPDRYLGADPSKIDLKHHDLTARNLPVMAHRHFPLCMVNMVDWLQRDHHLRHGGRHQLNLALKGVGLPMEEALIFWRTMWRNPAEFDKEHAYNVRHCYGKEGKRTDYTPHHCTTIVKWTVGQGDHHGCPYKVHKDEEDVLRGMLGRLQCEDSKISEAVSKSRAGHYQLACAAAFEGIHGCSCETGINLPAQYYQESRRVCDEKEGRSSSVVMSAGQAAAATTQQPLTPAMTGRPASDGSGATPATASEIGWCGSVGEVGRGSHAAGPSPQPAGAAVGTPNATR